MRSVCLVFVRVACVEGACAEWRMLSVRALWPGDASGQADLVLFSSTRGACLRADHCGVCYYAALLPQADHVRGRLRALTLPACTACTECSPQVGPHPIFHVSAYNCDELVNYKDLFPAFLACTSDRVLEVRQLDAICVCSTQLCACVQYRTDLCDLWVNNQTFTVHSDQKALQASRPLLLLCAHGAVGRLLIPM